MKTIETQHFQWVAASLLISFTPFVIELPIQLLLLDAGLVLLQLYFIHRKFELARTVVFLLLFLYILIIFQSYGSLVGQDVSTVFLMAMMTLKFLESKSSRDLNLVVYLTFMLAVSKFLYSQSMIVGLYLFLLVWFNCLVLMRLCNTQLKLSMQIKTAGKIIIQAIPLMLVMFVLFPRLSSPLWALPDFHKNAVTGVSDTMSPGQFSSLSLSSEVAFRVKFDGQIPRQQQLYWRGPVLWHYDGITWRRNEQLQSLAAAKLIPAENPVISYTVIMQSSGQQYLFPLEQILQVPSNTKLSNDYTLIHHEKLTAVKRFQMSSVLQYQQEINFVPNNNQYIAALSLPSGFNPKTYQFARTLRKQVNSHQEYIEKVLNYFHQQAFFYTLKPPRTGRNFVDDFLFNTRRGFCEHYASSFVVLMRAAGIPARVVTGYQGGEFNNSVGESYLIVRQSDAHAWAEVWLEGIGWKRIDPTAAVAPQRVEQGLDAAVPRSEGLSIFSSRKWSLLKQVQLVWDAANYQWHRLIINYDANTQQNLLSLFGFSNHWIKMILAIVVFASILVMIFLLLLYLREKEHLEPEVKTYLQFLKKCARLGVDKNLAEGPYDFSIRAASLLAKNRSEIIHICQLYQNIRYAGKSSSRMQGLLREKVKNFPKK